ncbi:DUF6281 family protein [Streptomyces parvulus]|uniref:DUF6281 family protein n=1 Tax=Streptomyces parvulus TaxID=146923 RepID=UPI0033DB395A
MTGKQTVGWTARGRMAGSTRVRAALVAAILIMSTSCAGAGTTQSGADSSCEALLVYGSHTYLGHGLHPDDEGDSVDVRAGKRLGTGTTPGCNDTPNDDEQEPTSEPVIVYAIAGVDPVDAVTVDHPAGGTLYIEQTSKKTLPELRKLLKAEELDPTTE